MKHCSDINIDNVSSTCKKLVRDLHLPGLSVGIVYKDDLIFSEGFGFADIETRKIQNPSLRHRIGSITKTMTGLCAMALVEEGKLSLNERVVDRLSDINIHGHADSFLIEAGSGALTLGEPDSAGVLADTAAHTRVLPYNDTHALKKIFESEGAEIAGVIVEPVC